MWKPRRSDYIEWLSQFIIQEKKDFVLVVLGVRLTQLKTHSYINAYPDAMGFVARTIRDCFEIDELLQDGDSVYVFAVDAQRENDVLDDLDRLQAVFENGYSVSSPQEILEPIFSVVGLSVLDHARVDTDGRQAVELAFRRAYCAYFYGRDQVPIQKQVIFDVDVHGFMVNGKYSSGAFKAALQAGAFTFCCMPIVCLKTGKIVSFEVLSRMKDQDNVFVMPSAYLGDMEPEILLQHDCAITAAAAHFLYRLRQDFPGINMNVNFSPRYLGNGGQSFIVQMPSIISRLFTDNDVSLDGIRFEIVEDGKISEQGWVVLSDLRQRGAKIILDDFGEAYASMARMEQFTFDGAKIDRSFLVRARRGPRSTILFSHLVRTGKIFDIPVVAEGVETSDDLDFAIQQGCDYAQGFLFGAPASPDVFEAYLHQNGGFVDLESLLEVRTRPPNLLE